MPASAKRVSYAKWQSMTPAQKAAKKRALGIPTIKGRGAYKINSSKNYSYSKPGPYGKVGRSLGKAAGSYFGGSAGRKVGKAVGGLAHYIGKIFGSGDYISSPGVKSNSILSPQIPSFSSGSATIRVRHREFLGDVFSSATANTFDINSYAINPGLTATLPWLSQVCGSTFQQYKLNGMVFEFRSMSSDSLNSTNTALGQVIMCTDYDSADVPFSSKQQMENTEFGVSCKPSSNMIHAIECAPGLTSVTEKYIRAFSNPVNTDIRLYDMGKFYIATNGCQGTSVNLGELWVSYDITLIKTIDQVPLYLAPNARYTLNSVSSTQALGSTQTAQVDQIGLTFDSANSIVYFPLSIQEGSIWELFYYVQGDVGPTIPVSSTATSGGMLNQWADSLSVPSGTSGTSTVKAYTCKYKYDGSGTPDLLPSIQFTEGVVPTNISVSTLSVYQVSGNLPTTNSAYLSALKLGRKLINDQKVEESPEYTVVEEPEQKAPPRKRL